MERADLDYLAETEGRDVDLKTVGEVSGEALDVELTHLNLELTAGLDTFGVTGDGEGYADGYWFVVEDLEEVDVENLLRDGVELDVFEDGLHLGAIDTEVDDVDIGGVDESTEVVSWYGESDFFLDPPSLSEDARNYALALVKTLY